MHVIDLLNNAEAIIQTLDSVQHEHLESVQAGLFKIFWMLGVILELPPYSSPQRTIGS